jgi:fructosamine-3-kinase
VSPLSGGCIGEVYRLTLGDGRHVVAKVDARAEGKLSIEAYMLGYLREHSALPVPTVLHSSPTLLLMTYIRGDSRFSAAAQESAAEHLAALHAQTGPAFGLERDTLIGGLHQPNPPTDSWITFFAEHRLRYMAREAFRAGLLPQSLLHRVEALADQCDRWLEEPPQPALIHGDVWTTNVLAADDRVTGFLDPAIYYAHPEIELAFTTLFGTFGEPFFERYQAIRPIRPGFFEQRRDIYNLYPLLVHVRLFGGSYVASVDRSLRQFGL